MQILVTGGTGFLGRALIRELAAGGRFSVRATLRQDPPTQAAGVSYWASGDIDQDTDWRPALDGIDAVVHTAALAHAKRPISDHRYRQVNVDATLNLAKQAATAGVRRFVFISSIGVYGDRTEGIPLTENSAINPHTAYASSKYAAEQGLRDLCAVSDMQLVVLRCPLIYGAEAPGNFRRLVRWVARGWPLPLGAVHNKRSLIALGNLVNLIIHCLDHPRAKNETFLVADSDSLSSAQIVRLLARGMGRPPRLVPVPLWLLRLILALLGRGSIYRQLCLSLQADTTKVRQYLDWQPPLSAEQALMQAAAEFKGVAVKSDAERV